MSLEQNFPRKKSATETGGASPASVCSGPLRTSLLALPGHLGGQLRAEKPPGVILLLGGESQAHPAGGLLRCPQHALTPKLPIIPGRSLHSPSSPAAPRPSSTPPCSPLLSLPPCPLSPPRHASTLLAPPPDHQFQVTMYFRPFPLWRIP